jgi:dienelactone hydrolase
MKMNPLPFLLLFALNLAAADSPVMEFWNAYDARKEPLKGEFPMKWEDEFGMYQLVRYDLGKLEGTNKSSSPKIAAYYGYPKVASEKSKVPGIVHIHGGGQRAHKGRVADWVKLGYAAISINWGGRVLEKADTQNTDWDGLAAGFERPGASGADDMIHHNGIMPGPNTLYKEPHILNSSWSLIAMSARRALTFLEQRPEVDGNKLGVEGHSMGGRSTVLTSIDPRIKASSPSVGGSGFLYEDMWGLTGSARRMSKEDGRDMYQQLISCQAYWPYIQAPLLFLGSTNDFNSPTELVVKGMSLLPEKTENVLVLAPHLNHRFTTDTAGARFLWMEAHLKGTCQFPKTSPSNLILKTEDKVPTFHLKVDQSTGLPIEKVQVFYGYARDPRIRFWRSAEVSKESPDSYSAKCPVFDLNEPLFAFANITYKLPKKLPARPGAEATDLLTISSKYQIAYPQDLKKAGVQATEKQQRLIEDFSSGWQDWYRLNHNNPHHWFYATRKIIDPSWIGPKGGKLLFNITTTEARNQLAVGIEANTWQGYTGRKKDTFHAMVQLPKAGPQTISLSPEDFKSKSGIPMTDWDEATELTFTPANRVLNTNDYWNGKPPTLANIRWEGGTPIKRMHPHETRVSKPTTTVSFSDEFQQAIDDSVALERMDEKAIGNKDGTVWLTKEMASEIRSFSHVRNNQSWSGKKISINSITHERGIGVHADSRLTFPLSGKYANFHVLAGPDDGHQGQLEMKILVDGKQVFTTGPTQSSNKIFRQPVDIPLKGAKSLTLTVDSLGNKGGDHASWANARLTKTKE